MPKTKDTAGNNSNGSAVRWKLCLFYSGDSTRSRAAKRNLELIREKHLHGNCDIEHVDIEVDPESANSENILATPLLVRFAPGPKRRIIGDLSQVDRVLEVLELA